MPATRLLIVFGTYYGQTERIANSMADVLRKRGDFVTVINVKKVPRSLAPGDYDGILIGGSIQFNHHQRSLRAFVRAQRATLNAMPSAFFSVSGSGAARTSPARSKAEGYVAEFLSETGWHPSTTAAFGGAVAYTKYNPILRWVMRRIAAKSGQPTDTSRDHSLTDWAEVERFATAFASRIAHTTTARPRATAGTRQ